MSNQDRKSYKETPEKPNHSQQNENIFHILNKFYNKKSSQVEERSMHQICIDSDDEERKLRCGGFVREEQLNLPRTETTNLLSQNQVWGIHQNKNESKNLTDDTPNQ